ncbi:MAG TPA: ligase-associated DNA damage response endonuclease PdeM [Chryseosolibacter sp.]|nr:ligase-associated DNA damage response endonuclease PdeM [Chryseosolibacter sp.]
MEIEILGEEVSLFPQKVMFWKKHGILLVADLHLGKVNHFRRSGIPVPARANDHNLEMLVDVVTLTHPSRVIFLGDLFHSHYNPEWEVFGELVKHFSAISFELVIGNHDIMSDLQYARKGIILHEQLIIGPFIFTHHPLEDIPSNAYNIAGHIHPGVHLRGKGKQAMTLPCFYFGLRQGLLPAFGTFTGLARIAPKKNDKVFVVADNKIMAV